MATNYREGAAVRRARRLGIAALAACGVLVLAMTAPKAQQAQPQSPTAQQPEENFSAEHLAKAQRVVELTKSAEGFDEILPIVAEQTLNLFIRNHPALTADIEAVTTETALGMAATRRELNETIQKIWARRFSEDELDELITFFGSPVGQKFAVSTATIAALSVGASEQWGNKLATEMVTVVREELRKRGHQL